MKCFRRPLLRGKGSPGRIQIVKTKPTAIATAAPQAHVHRQRMFTSLLLVLRTRRHKADAGGET